MGEAVGVNRRGIPDPLNAETARTLVSARRLFFRTLTFVARTAKLRRTIPMSQYTIDFSQHKTTNGSGKHGRVDERELAADLSKWLTDLNDLEAMRKQELRAISKLRREVYAHAAKRGMSPAMLRATFKLAKE